MIFPLISLRSIEVRSALDLVTNVSLSLMVDLIQSFDFYRDLIVGLRSIDTFCSKFASCYDSLIPVSVFFFFGLTQVGSIYTGWLSAAYVVRSCRFRGLMMITRLGLPQSNESSMSFW